MIRIALCGHISLVDGDVAEALAGRAQALGLGAPVIETFDNPTDLIEACLTASGSSGPFDLVVASLQLKGISGVHMSDELANAGLINDGLRVVLCANDRLHAIHAAQSYVCGYLVEPIERSRFDNLMDWVFRGIAHEHASSIVFNCRDGVRRVLTSHLTYVETSGRDQLVHRIGESAPLSIRCSSRALFADLAHDERFYKVGSSYIVNLDYVSSFVLRGSTATLFDGTKIAVPVRLRTALADAMCKHALVSI